MLSLRTMKPNNLITFIMEKAHAHGSQQEIKTGKQQSNKDKEKSMSSVTCKNCKSSGQTKADCWSKSRGKEGQGPRGQNFKKGEKRQKQL